MTNSERLTATYEKKAAAGLVDVKFSIENAEGATHEKLCGEVLALEDAIERGDYTPLDFGDLHWRE